MSPSGLSPPVRPRSADIHLSNVNYFMTIRNPNLPPPIRTNDLPHLSSSQQSETPSSPDKPLAELRKGRLVAKGGEDEENVGRGEASFDVEGAEEEGGDVGGDGHENDEEDEDEFAGLETMGASQWVREVEIPRKARSSDKAPSSSVHDIDEVNEKYLSHGETHREPEYNSHAGPSSPALRTPAFSHTHTHSDLPSCPYPETPHTPCNTTPSRWTSSPLPSGSKGKSRSRGDNAMLYDPATRSDDEEHEKENDENLPPRKASLSSGPVKVVKSKGKGRKIILDSDDEEALNEKSNRKGKAKEERTIELDVQTMPIDLANDDDDDDMEAHVHQNGDKPGDDDDGGDDDFGMDFPFDQVDLDSDFNFDHLTRSDQNQPVRTRRSKSPTKRSAAPLQVINDSFSNGFDFVALATSTVAEGTNTKDDPFPVIMISDMEPKWQEFYLNHFRRAGGAAAAGGEKKRTVVEALNADDDEEEDARGRMRTMPQKAAAGNRGKKFVSRGGGAWRGAWRGRGRTKKK
nr:uncharacterized protein CI109_002750 [Kwoniella shandongensis]KAA5528992.1 hypothetical protein CI109_002750 [Kwoniella shandongensis]